MRKHSKKQFDDSGPMFQDSDLEKHDSQSEREERVYSDTKLEINQIDGEARQCYSLGTQGNSFGVSFSQGAAKMK